MAQLKVNGRTWHAAMTHLIYSEYKRPLRTQIDGRVLRKCVRSKYGSLCSLDLRIISGPRTGL